MGLPSHDVQDLGKAFPFELVSKQAMAVVNHVYSLAMVGAGVAGWVKSFTRVRK